MYSRKEFSRSAMQKILLSTQTRVRIIMNMFYSRNKSSDHLRISVFLVRLVHSQVRVSQHNVHLSVIYTVHSFVEMTLCSFSSTEVQFVLSEKLCQDPLESLFSKKMIQEGLGNKSREKT